MCVKKPQLPQDQAQVVSGATQHRMDRIAKRPLSQFRSSFPSDFMYPIVGSIALRRLIIAFKPRVTPRRCPDLHTWTPSTSTPR